jgi:hypothetical protein
MSAPLNVKDRLLRGALLVSAVGVFAACEEDSKLITSNDAQRVSLALQNQNTDGGGLMLDPRTATLHVGYGMLITVNITDADGQPIPGARPTWRSTNPAIVRVTALPDSGISTDGRRAAIAGVTEGSAMVIASYGTSADTAHISVAPARVDSSGTGGGGRPVPVPNTFDVGIFVSTAFDSTMFALWRYEPVVNASVRLILLPREQGDTLPASVTSVTQPTPFKTLVADTAGFVVFRDVPMGRFRIEVTPPAGSAWEPWSYSYGPPYVANVRYHIQLKKN